MNIQLPLEHAKKFLSLVKTRKTVMTLCIALMSISVGYSQTNTAIICADGPVNTTYCYTNNDLTSFTFVGDTAFPLRLSFNAGTVENPFDDVIILDTDGVTNINPTPNGNAGDFTGLVFESTGNEITFMMDSDASVNCADNGFTPFDFDVVCLTCIEPVVAFVGDEMCDPGQMYSVTADITDLGSATTLTVTDNQGSAPQSVMAPGQLVFGPYNPALAVIFSVDTGDANCNFDSEEFVCVVQGNCDFVDAGSDIFLECETECVDIVAAFIAIPNRETTGYTIQGPLCDIPPLTGGDPTSIDVDDEWSDPIVLPFEFSFYGVTYNSIVVSGNGVASFDASLNGFHTWIMDPTDMIPMNTPGLVANSIFGAYHDINPASVPTNINFFVIGTAPFRTFVLNFNEIPQFDCTDLLTTQQILLYESLNVIDINIVNKDVCTTWNDGLAVIALQGNNLTEFSVPEDRNVGVWTAMDESWRFVPNGAPINASTFEWRDAAGTVLGNDALLNVCPEATTTYTAALVVELPDGSFQEITDDVIVAREEGCVLFDCTDLVLVEDFETGTGRVTHPFTPLDFNGTTQMEANEYTVSNTSAGLNTGWFDDVQDNTDDDTDGRMIFFNPSEDVNEIELYRRTVLVTANTNHIFDFFMTTVYDTNTNICPGGGAPSNLDFRIEDAGGTTIVTGNTGDVANGTAPNWTRYSIEFNSGVATEIQIVIENTVFAACGNDLAIDDIRIFAEGLPPVLVAPMDLSLCDETGSEEATFDLTSTAVEILNGQNAADFNFSYHISQADADLANAPIATPAAYVNVLNPETIFVRVARVLQATCFSTTSFDLLIGQPIVITTDLPTEIEFCPDVNFEDLDATPTNAGIDLSTVTYEWTDPVGAVVSTNAVYLPVTSGIHTVVVSVPPCSEMTFTVDVIILDVPVLDLGLDATICDGEDFTINPIITGDATGATFLWSTGEITQSITVNQSGTYTLELTTINGCIITDEIVVLILDPVVVSLGDDFDVCPDFQNTITATSNETNLTYEWFLNDDLLAGETGSSINFSLPENTSAEYSVVVTNANGCMGTDSIVIGINDPLTVALTNDPETCPEFDNTISATTSETGVTYEWFADGVSVQGETNNTLVVSLPENATTTQYSVVITNAEGCTGTDSTTISLYTDNANCVITQGISPNGDGMNDELDLSFLANRTGIDKLQIYNRLGALVYEFDNYSNQWFGQTDDGEELPTGTYFYVLTLRNVDSGFETQTPTGWIYINRDQN